jgi:hypothetical protein
LSKRIKLFYVIHFRAYDQYDITYTPTHHNTDLLPSVTQLTCSNTLLLDTLDLIPGMSNNTNLGIRSVSKTIYAVVIWKLGYTDICNTQFFLTFCLLKQTRNARPKTAPLLKNKYKNGAANFIEDFNILKVLTFYIHIHEHLM